MRGAQGLFPCKDWSPPPLLVTCRAALRPPGGRVIKVPWPSQAAVTLWNLQRMTGATGAPNPVCGPSGTTSVPAERRGGQGPGTMAQQRERDPGRVGRAEKDSGPAFTLAPGLPPFYYFCWMKKKICRNSLFSVTCGDISDRLYLRFKSATPLNRK